MKVDTSYSPDPDVTHSLLLACGGRGAVVVAREQVSARDQGIIERGQVYNGWRREWTHLVPLVPRAVARGQVAAGSPVCL